MSQCPSCGGADIAMILFGLPDGSPELKKKVADKKIVLGGCIVGDKDHNLECNDCGWRWCWN
jgi:hypothetical protein